MGFWIIADSSTDFPTSYIEKQNRLKIIPLTYEIEGQVYTPSGKEDETKAFYTSLREGKIATTAQINIQVWKDSLLPLVEKGEEVLCLPFSSGLSGTCAAAFSAKEEIDQQFPNNNLIVIDTLAASLGHGLLVHYALKMRDEGHSLQEVATWVNENILHLAHWFTVDDLQFLRRGGRLSTASAYIGSILKVKPVLHVDNKGYLIPMEKVQGRKKSLKALLNKVEETAIHPEDQVVFISHGDCLEDAQYLENLLKKQLGVKEVMISLIGPVIGSHSGPGTVAIFFLASKR